MKRKRFITKEEACRMLGVNEKQLNNFVLTRGLPAYDKNKKKIDVNKYKQ